MESLDEQLRVYELVRANDLVGLAAAARAHGAALWTTLLPCERTPVYPNRGTVVHWAVWHRHFAVAALAAAAGADLGVAGQGCWMNGRTAAQYAELLDQRAGHRFYQHVTSLQQALAAPALAAVEGADARAQLNAASALRGATAQDLETPEVQVALHDMVEHHCMAGLALALAQFGSAALATTLVGPRDNPYRNVGPLAHWAIWYQDWLLLAWLRQRNCVSTTVRSQGIWMRDRTLVEYADKLDSECRHPFYRHAVEVALCLRQPAGPATDPTAGAGPPPAAPEEPAPAAEQPARGRCCVCLDAQADHIVLPCRHLCLCAACSTQLRGHPCPMCRAAANAIEEVFMV